MRRIALPCKQICLLITFLLIFYGTIFSQATFTKTATIISIASFGANGSDANDDTWAFVKAGRYINNQWDINGVPLTNGTVNYNAATNHIRLEIPSGTYYVGKQITMPPASCSLGYNTTYGQVFGYPAATAPINLAANRAKWFGLEVISLSNVNEVEIVGTGTKPLIKYNLGLYLGYFDCNGTAKTFNGTETGSGYSNIYESNIGSFVLTLNCKNILVQNLEINGNNNPPPTSTPSATATNYGGTIGTDKIQLGGDGFLLLDSKKITIDNLNVHHMTRDGIQLSDTYTTPTSTDPALLTNLSINNSIFDNNRRQGFSWVGGRGVAATSSKFNNTGQSVFNWNSGVARGNPGAGIDIEPNGSVYCMDANFTTCEFVNNTGLALVNDVSVRTKNINFNSTKFHDVDDRSIWVTGPGFTFNDCKIWGNFVYGNGSGTSGEETRFFNCDFADEEYLGVFAGVSQLIETSSAKKMLFSNCTFRTIHPNIRTCYIITPSFNETDFTKFSNCTFSYGVSSTTTAGGDIIYRCIFDGANTLTNNNTASKYFIHAKGLIFTGSNNSCSPNSFSSNGLIEIIYDVNGEPLPVLTMGRDVIGGTTNNGYFNFNVGDKSLLYLYYYSKVNIGGNSNLSNKPGGMLVVRGGNTTTGNTVINNNGKIILEPNSSTLFPDPLNTEIVGGNGSEFYYHKNATINPNTYWTFANLGIVGQPLQSLQLTNTKFDGGNTSITNTNLITSANEALQFDGINDYVKIPFASGTTPLGFDKSALNSFGIEIAFKRSNNANFDLLFCQVNGLNIFFEADALGISFDGGETAALSINDTKCHFLTVTRGSNLKISAYVDGSLFHVWNPITEYMIDPSYTNYLIDPYNTVYLGTSNIYGAFFSGWIGQVRLWSRELTQNDICRNYKWKTPYNSTGLFADWDMTDASGTTLTNRINPSATANGTLINGPIWNSQNAIGDCIDAFGANNSFNNLRPAKIIANSLEPIHNNFSIYPNPNSGGFKLKYSTSDVKTKQTVDIYNTVGKLIFTKILSGTSPETLQPSIIASGIYILRLTTGNGKILTKKLVINK